MQYQGHVEIVYMSLKAKKQTAKKYLAQLQKDNSNIKKKYIKFEIGSLVVFQSRTQEESEDYFPYTEMKSIGILDENKIFLKTTKKAIMILFENTNPKNCETIFKSLQFFKARYKQAENPIKMYKLEEVELKWSEIEFSYKFDFEKLAQKSIN